MKKEEIEEIEEFIKIMPKDKIQGINKEEFEEAKKLYGEFCDKFSKEECSFCNSTIKIFNEDSPCMHWLLCPEGFRKKHFKLIIENFGYFRINTYLRWVASQEALFKNINDLTDERRDSMMFEYTIRYSNIKWSFSCSKGDFEGHKNSKSGKYPHYHFQMRIGGKPFINFNNFHIPLTHYDEYVIHARRGEIPGIVSTEYFGASVKDLFGALTPEEILRYSKTTDDYGSSTLNTSYIVEAEPGTTLSGDDIADIIEEGRRIGTPLWNLLPKLKNIGKTVAIVSPGEGVVEMNKRNKRGDKNEKSKA